MHTLELNIVLHPSKQFIILLLLIITACLFCITQLTIFFLAKVILTLFVVLYTGYIFWRDVMLKHPDSILHLNYDGKKCYAKTSANRYAIEITGDSTITSWVSVLRFKIEGQRRKYTAVVFKDSTSKDHYRKLLVILLKK